METFKKPDLMEWHEGKVKGFFGKDLLSLKNGSVKLVKVATKKSYPMHQHPDKIEYIYVIAGNPTVIINDVERVGEKGDFFTLPTAINHSIVNDTDFECLLLVGAISKS